MGQGPVRPPPVGPVGESEVAALGSYMFCKIPRELGHRAMVCSQILRPRMEELYLIVRV